MGQRKGCVKTGGRKKGTPNKINALLKDSILMAAEQAGNAMTPGGGIASYLTMQASLNPSAFMNLLGKVLPTQLTGDAASPVHVKGETDGFGAFAQALGSIAAARQGGDLDATGVADEGPAKSDNPGGGLDDVVDSGGAGLGQDADWSAGCSVVRPN